MTATVLISCLVLAALALAARSVWRSHRRGSCPGCSCGDHCDRCK